MKPEFLWKTLGINRGQFARALGVNDRTIARWDDGTVEPLGIAAEVIAGITDAIRAGADPKRIGVVLTHGIRLIVSRNLTQESKPR